MIKEYVKKQTFNPNLLGLFINPFYFARKSLYKNVSSVAHHIKGDVLDVGCGQKPYKHLFNTSKYIGIEVEQEGHDHTNEDVDVFYDGRHIPFGNETFDSVITSQVLEHVFTPDEFLTEINRVVKQGGKLLLTVPFVWDEHEQPYDYARYSSFGLTSLLQKNGFEIEIHIKSLNDTRVIFQLINVYIFKKTLGLRKSPISNIIASLFFNSLVNILGSTIGFILPKNDDLYLDNIIIARKK
ncbi:MAG: class I SAM-dependent methyltransferase [Saprospiraceae bacterium]|nr:class I SAM-dependent methyltransferase [Saprospiraceae bacterium]